MQEAATIIDAAWGDQQVTSQDAIAAIVSSEGNLDLAAEMLFGMPVKGAIAPKAQLIAVIAADPNAIPELQRQLRTLTLLQTFQSAAKVGFLVDGTLVNQAPEDLIKLYTSLLKVVEELTNDHVTSFNANVNATSLNLTEVVLRQLPPEVREALKALSAGADEAGSLPANPAGPSSATNSAPTPWSGGDSPPNAAVSTQVGTTGE